MPAPDPPAPPDLPAEPPSPAELDTRGVAEARLEGLELDGARLRGARVVDVVASNGSWANIDLRESTLRRVEVRGVRATGATFADGRLEDVRFVECRLDLASFRFAKLERVVFEQCRLEEADFYEARLASTVFAGCTLTGANLAGATFAASELRGCELDGIAGAERLRGVRMPWPDVVAAAGTLAAAIGIEIAD